MTPVPEPAKDIDAQLAAVMNPAHPKRACFLVAQDVGQIPYGINAFIEARPEGTLVTTDETLADLFRNCPGDQDSFDRIMAEILGYPEAKPLVVARCAGDPIGRAIAVQARDASGCVVTEAFASREGMFAACAALRPHVPPGGKLLILTPTEAIGRRIMMRGETARG